MGELNVRSLAAGSAVCVVLSNAEPLLAGEWVRATRGLVSRTSALLVFWAAWWMYFDGLDRLSNGEAVLWATALLVFGFVAMVFGPLPFAVVAAVLVGGYSLRRRTTTAADAS